MSTVFAKINDPIYILHSKDQSPYKMDEIHYHDCFELIFFLSNNVTYFIKDKLYNIKKYDLLFISPFELHRVTDTGEKYYERIVINLSKEYFDSSISGTKAVNFFTTVSSKISLNNAEINNIFLSLLHEKQLNDEFSKERVKLLVKELFILLNREVENYNMQTDSNVSNERILSIISYINDNYMDNITLSSLAEKFYISPYYLGHLFKKVTGFTIIKYLNKKRISVAQQLLATGKYKISTVCEMVGYNNLTSFSRTFKAVSGVSPMQYKKQYKL
ncbi:MULTISPECIES: AraC family transcriptional regulator [Thermoanaerobacterium]|uniref:AraC family transcriptional regulator n=2 Tax=Thermoanaerobacterium TaxID=28895 RepID=W9EIY6_9THEO|nr:MULTISPECIES: helix-turn-helix domain-containing protein [Thermoanaerobacterium]AFK85528.1 transcriptional regulator, AraC family [Thermoanaerobacterium saccharolyticum JW/SL-YS485]ETO39659.1 AraC family transcriptional regulator [Thermoanaerobacterium aotearoense SCUT27]